MGEVETQKDRTVKQQEYWGAYQTAPNFGIAQRRPGGGHGVVGSFEIRGIDTFYDPVSYRFYINPITRCGFGEKWSTVGPGLWPIQNVRFVEEEAAVGSVRCLAYTVYPKPDWSWDVRLWIDEKTLVPKKRHVEYEHDGTHVRFSEEYRGFSTDELEQPAYANRLAPALIQRGRLSAQVDGQWKSTEWLVNKRRYRADAETELTFDAGDRIVLAEGCEVTIDDDLTIHKGHLSALLRANSGVRLELVGVRFSDSPHTSGRSRITASADRIVAEQGAARAHSDEIRKIRGGFIRREGIEYLIRDGMPQPQPQRTQPPEPDWGDDTRVIFALDMSDAESLARKLQQGTLAEFDGRPVLESLPVEGDKLTRSITYVAGEGGLFQWTPATRIRFRYHFSGGTTSNDLSFAIHNRTRNRWFEYRLLFAQSRHWTTFELPLTELETIGTGIQTASQPGDVFDQIRWTTIRGNHELMIDQLEVYE